MFETLFHIPGGHCLILETVTDIIVHPASEYGESRQPAKLEVRAGGRSYSSIVYSSDEAAYQVQTLLLNEVNKAKKRAVLAGKNLAPSLYQLPKNGNWINLLHVTSVLAYSKELWPRNHIRVSIKAGDEIIDCESYEEACTLRDEIARASNDAKLAVLESIF